MATPSIDLLARGAVSVKGRMPWSSNATFLVEVALGEAQGLAVYKPAPAERPLWDFSAGLFQRELGAWLLSEALGEHLVPPTLPSDDPPLRPGALHHVLDAHLEQHY